MSMNCPKCSGTGACIDSRRKLDSSTTRRYRCAAGCGAKWSTSEVIVHVDATGGTPRRGGRRLSGAVESRFKREANDALRKELSEFLGTK